MISQWTVCGACAFALALPPAPAQTLEGAFDIHVHAGPDSVPRSIDALEIARLARARGLRGIVLKNHYEPTATLAALARRAAPGLEVFGGIALNRAVGGLNLAAVERMMKVEGGWGRIVWMPTFDAENQVRALGESRPFVRISQGGRLLPEVVEVLALVARHKLILATGHSSPAEVTLLIGEARRLGIERILVTHAMLAPVSLTPDQTREAARQGAFIEFVANSLIGASRSLSFAAAAQAIRAAGVENSILASDFGQAGNPLHPDGLETVLAGLRAEGLTADEIDALIKRNPARLLGLP